MRRAKYNRKVSNPNGYFIKRLVSMSHFFAFSLASVTSPLITHLSHLFFPIFLENTSNSPGKHKQDSDHCKRPRLSPDVVPQQQFPC